MHNRRKPSKVERYDIERSPLSQRPTQRQLAELVGMSRDDLRRLVSYKEQFIVRRQEEINGKLRDLAYPVGLLRVVHEKLKYHLNKVKQPDYLFSPRRGRSQRDNAEQHACQAQYLTLDLKQFYPSTSLSMVRNWLIGELNMFDDVAGLLAKLVCVDGKVSFGSPLTPVLCTLVHRQMFNEIATLCESRNLRYTVWIDDLTISGTFVPGEVLTEIRAIVRRRGLRSHKISYRSGNRPVFLTGIGVIGRELIAPNGLHIRIKGLWRDLYRADTFDERECISRALLSQLGTLKYIVGAKSEAGRKVSDQMNSLRQKRDKWRRQSTEKDQSRLDREIITLGPADQRQGGQTEVPWA